MNFSNIARIRLHNQFIGGGNFSSIKEVVTWMGAMQAQDLAMVKWALGIRLPGSTEKLIEAAFDDGQILRTHLLRPTWHLVSQDDLSWMLDLTAPSIKASMSARHRELGLSREIISKSNAVIEKALRDGEHLPREELVARLNQAGIATDENRASHLFVCAELDGILCSGKLIHGRQTYALLENRAAKAPPVSKETALGMLAHQYFTSRAPATLKDFTWWSGLTSRAASTAFEVIRENFISETIAGNVYWFPNDTVAHHNSEAEQVYLLPAFDEFIIAYADRGAVLPAGIGKKAISENGVFRPVVVLDGQAIGIWKRRIKKEQVSIEIELFHSRQTETKSLIEAAARQYGQFLEKEAELIWVNHGIH